MDELIFRGPLFSIRCDYESLLYSVPMDTHYITHWRLCMAEGGRYLGGREERRGVL